MILSQFDANAFEQYEKNRAKRAVSEFVRRTQVFLNFVGNLALGLAAVLWLLNIAGLFATTWSSILLLILVTVLAHGFFLWIGLAVTGYAYLKKRLFGNANDSSIPSATNDS